MSETIIELLKKKNDYYSGAALSAELKITRAAVWKKISALRKKGFIIEAIPSKGYRLVSPPDLSEDYVKSACRGKAWKDITVYDRVNSTNELAMARASGNVIRTPAVIIADSQEKGKGRLGRQWFSPAGNNIYMSLVFQPQLETRDATMLTLLAAVACVHSIRTICGLTIGIKWPNDLIIAGKKLGGILTEIRADIDKVNLAVIGIGINFNQKRRDFPEELRKIATSVLEESGKFYSRNDLIIEILGQFQRFYVSLLKKGKQPLLQEWKRLSSTIGQRVKVVRGDQVLTGLAEDIDSNGMLILKMDSGCRQRINAGDITHLR